MIWSKLYYILQSVMLLPEARFTTLLRVEHKDICEGIYSIANEGNTVFAFSVIDISEK